MPRPFLSDCAQSLNFVFWLLGALYMVQNDRNHWLSGYAAHFWVHRVITFWVIEQYIFRTTRAVKLGAYNKINCSGNLVVYKWQHFLPSKLDCKLFNVLWYLSISQWTQVPSLSGFAQSFEIFGLRRKILSWPFSVV